MSLYYPLFRRPVIEPYHAHTALPVPDAYAWIRGAQPGQSFVLRDGPLAALSTAHRLWLDVWEGEGFITYGAVKASPAALSSDEFDWRVHVTRTDKKL